MAVIRAICGEVAVLEGGRIAEQGMVQQVFDDPRTAAAKELIHVQ
jgi:D-methionine transport system ATP-binding protein